MTLNNKSIEERGEGCTYQFIFSEYTVQLGFVCILQVFSSFSYQWNKAKQSTIWLQELFSGNPDFVDPVY